MHGSLQTLQAHGFVEQDRGSAGTARARAAAARKLLPGLNELLARSLVPAERLAQRADAAVRVGVMHGSSVVVVHHVFRPDETLQILEVGAQLPVHASALGKAILAYASPAVVEDLTAEPLPKLTSRTLSARELRAQFPAIRERGVARERDEAICGESSVAAPIFDHGGQAVGAVGVVGDTERIVPRAPAKGLVAAVAEAPAISRELGAHSWPGAAVRRGPVGRTALTPAAFCCGAADTLVRIVASVEDHSTMSNDPRPVRRGPVQEHSLSQRAVAETLGTALLVLVGPGSVVATLVLAGKSTPAVSGADLLGISFAFGFIIAAMVYAIGKVSGCHINPAVTFALAATKRFPWREVPSYWAAQVVGAVLGALGIWALFGHTGIDLGMGQTSFNQDATTWASAIFAEGIGTFMLMAAIRRRLAFARGFAGLIIGGVVMRSSWSSAR